MAEAFERRNELAGHAAVAGDAAVTDRIRARSQPLRSAYLARMRAADVHAFLVGEAFMRAADPGVALAALFESEWPDWYNARGASARTDLSERMRRDGLPLGIVALVYSIFRLIFTVLMPPGIVPEGEILAFIRTLFAGGN